MYSGLRKLVGVLLLLWTVLDLSVPGMCKTDVPDFSSTQTTSVSGTPSVDQQQQSQMSLEDDCFCCCAHVAPSRSVMLATPGSTVTDWPSYVIETPREFASSLYHPPRT